MFTFPCSKIIRASIDEFMHPGRPGQANTWNFFLAYVSRVLLSTTTAATTAATTTSCCSAHKWILKKGSAFVNSFWFSRCQVVGCQSGERIIGQLPKVGKIGVFSIDFTQLFADTNKKGDVMWRCVVYVCV